MSAFKKLNRQDVFLTPYTAKKSWSVEYTNLENYGIETRKLIEGIPFFSGSNNYTEELYYRSLYQLYYSNFTNSSVSGSFENFIQSSFETGSRDLGINPYLISFPRNIVGNKIEPGTLSLEYGSLLGGGTNFITDNGEGKLITNNTVVGDIIYPHGVCVITQNSLASGFDSSYVILTASWNSNVDILTGNYVCKLKDYEFNYSQNPSTTPSGSTGLLRDNITGSYFHPYITAVGLYNDANELIAVGKLGQTVPKLPDTEMTFILKLDF